MLGFVSPWNGHRIMRLGGTSQSIRSARSISVSSSGGGLRAAAVLRRGAAGVRWHRRNDDRRLRRSYDRGLGRNDDRGLDRNDGRCGRRLDRRAIAGQFFPAVRRVAPAPAELQIDPHRHFERDGVAAEPRDQLGLLARAHRAVQAIMHLQQRHDAFTPAGAHPKFGVPRRRALNQRIERRVDVGADSRWPCQGCSGSAMRRRASSIPHGPAPLAKIRGTSHKFQCRRAPS